MTCTSKFILFKEVPEKELRCAVGPILCKGKEKPAKEEMDLMVKHGYNIFYLPDPGFVVQTSFPYRTTISILIAIWRVYPKLKKYITVKNLCAYPAIEVYQSEDILFMMPLSHQESSMFITIFIDRYLNWIIDMHLKQTFSHEMSPFNQP